MRTGTTLALLALLAGACASPPPIAGPTPSAALTEVSPSPPLRVTPAAPTTSFPPNAFVMPGHLSFIDAHEGWLGMGDQSGSLMLHTADGGASWTRLPVPGPEGALQFVDAEHGWLVSTSVFRTADGGRTWQLSLKREGSPSGAPVLGNFSAVDATHAWVTQVPAGCNIPLCGLELLRTVDGSTWDSVGMLPAYGEVRFVDRATGWAGVFTADAERLRDRSNEASILVTHDGGVTWARQFHGTGAQPGITLSFADAQHGWALGSERTFCSMGGCGGYTLYRTSDGGDHWQAIQSGDDGKWWGPTPEGASAAGFLGQPTFVDTRNGWLTVGTGAGGGAGGILVTHDGGEHWSRYSGDGGVWSVGSIAGVGRERAWATVLVRRPNGESEHAVVMTTDGGKTWSRQLSWAWRFP
ncbi:MAG: hypothetical protein M3046_11705 [Actinomycetota bacterium]|nr:hypothetical protein [Actinomycetota bacterium]